MQRLTTLALVLVAALLAACSSITPGSSSKTAGENWPRFRGPNGQGHSSETGLPVTWRQFEHRMEDHRPRRRLVLADCLGR